MSGAKKIEPIFDDVINAKIQRKFDMIFNGSNIKKNSNIESADLFADNGADFEVDGMNMDKNNKNSDKTVDISTIDLDFTADDDSAPETPVSTASTAAKTATIPGDDGLDFSLDFTSEEESVFESTPATPAADESPASEDEGFSLEGIEVDEMNFDESTKKTIVIKTEHLTKSNLEEFSLDSSSNSSSDLMSTEEARANIETTIKDILRPKLDSSEASPEVSAGGLDDIEDSVLDFGGNTPSKGFVLDEVGDSDDFLIDNPAPKATSAQVANSNDLTGEFSIDSEDFDIPVNDMNFSSDVDSDEKTRVHAPPQKASVINTPSREQEVSKSAPVPTFDSIPSIGVVGSGLNTEDSMRFQATIRALREEREDFLQQIKSLKLENKELEQDNLTIKANLDEAKIEITILRKRHMVEVEDIKYRLSMTEEKKAMADEKARQADLRREKLEQKVRIDFNQVKQREKELESKLELLSMDVDSQVQSRDHKILELRRKIDALEFNMENASIKEQKSLDDKRKLEDRLNKIMKTLRHSIKNLEDDIDHAQEDDDHQKEKN